MTSSMISYLIVRDGNKWSDVHRLVPGQVTTIGRAATNRLVLPDEICSRNHCEVFLSSSHWWLRDLGSRNGTLVNEHPVSRDVELKQGDIIQLGTSQLVFTHDLAATLPQLEEENDSLERDTGTAVVSDSSSGPEILHRQRNTRYQQTNTLPRDRVGSELARIYRMALDMGAASNSKQLAGVVLKGLLEATPAAIGAVLLVPSMTGEKESKALVPLAYLSKDQLPYERVSEQLSRVVLRDREAILARDVTSDSRITKTDSLGELQAQSVLCAPIRVRDVIYGLIHLYATDLENPLEVENLEFALAVADQFAVALERLLREESLVAGLAVAHGANETLREQLQIESELVGSSPGMQQLRHNISRIAPTDATVLIRGESGVGKELVSRAIHFGSHRRNGPFVCMNCAALSESLLESELFGHEKGSFTGATGRKLGKFEQAHRGTLMLDEVGEMSLAIQAKFLRVLEGHPYERVGGGTTVRSDVRVVAATNRNLESAVEAGTFRKDLYFRLEVIEIEIPPLREHPSDIPLLAHHFLRKAVQKSGRQIQGFEPEALECLSEYSWPGNVRELQNAIERAVILCSGETVTAADIRLSHLGNPTADSPHRIEEMPSGYRQVSLESLEQDHILATLELTGWNKSQAAQILGIERSTLDRKLKRYQVSRPDE